MTTNVVAVFKFKSWANRGKISVFSVLCIHLRPHLIAQQSTILMMSDRRENNANLQWSETSTPTTASTGMSTLGSSSFLTPRADQNFTVQERNLIAEQQQEIADLKKKLEESNCKRYWNLQKMNQRIGSGKNIVRDSKKVSMTGTDSFNQFTLATYLHENVWPYQKMLLPKWNKY
jgi:hypothetical protein